MQRQSIAYELPAVEYELARQLKHTSGVVAAIVDEYVPVLQEIHALEPLLLLYLPISHELHSDPSVPVWPAKQVQAVILVLFDAEDEFVGQGEQVLTEIAPTALE